VPSSIKTAHGVTKLASVLCLWATCIEGPD